jgi:hypothetical protein
MGTKQCAGCGAQIGASARECPVCGRGSLLGELGMFAFLGVLLLGIGLASGLIPLNRLGRRPESAPTAAASLPQPEKSKPMEKPAESGPRRTAQASRRSAAPVDGRRQLDIRAILAHAPCSDPDTAAVERLIRKESSVEPSHLRAVACEASIGYQATSPDTAPPASSQASPSSSGAVFITPSDSMSR